MKDLEWKLLSKHIPDRNIDCLCMPKNGDMTIMRLEGEITENGGAYFWTERGEWECNFKVVHQWSYLPNPKEIML